MKRISIIQEADQHATLTVHPRWYGQIAGGRALVKVKLTARYVMLLDKFYEIGDRRYRAAALLARAELTQHMGPKEKLKFWAIHKKLNTFWKYSSGLLNRKRFNAAQRQYYLQRKSSDVLLYCTVANLPFRGRIGKALYACQQLNDIDDDLRDLREDISDGSPNLVLLFSPAYRRVANLKAKERTEILKLSKTLLANVRASTVPFVQRAAERHFRRIKKCLDTTNPAA